MRIYSDAFLIPAAIVVPRLRSLPHLNFACP